MHHALHVLDTPGIAVHPYILSESQNTISRETHYYDVCLYVDNLRISVRPINNSWLSVEISSGSTDSWTSVIFYQQETAGCGSIVDC